MNDHLSIWTIYDHPRDFPHSYVARRFEIRGPEPIATDDIVIGELSNIRLHFHRAGLTCLPRQTGDEAKIVECWL